jgi:hypothetical protein
VLAQALETLRHDQPARSELSKSRVMSGIQCHKLLWWIVNEPSARELGGPLQLFEIARKPVGLYVFVRSARKRETETAQRVSLPRHDQAIPVCACERNAMIR